MNKEQEIEEPYQPFENEDNMIVIDLYRSILVEKLKKLQKAINVGTGDEYDYCSKSSEFQTYTKIINIIKST